MKPKTKIQRRIVELSSKLPAITEKQINWAYTNLFMSYAYMTKKGTTCFDCGHTWVNGTLICPNCGKKLHLRNNKRERVFADWDYYCILTTSGGFQVNRFFYVNKYCKAGKTAEYFISEVVQQWIDEKGQCLVIAKTTVNMFSNSNWNFSGNLEIRRLYGRYNIYPGKVYPRKKVIPTLKRNGFNGELYNFSPLYFMTQLLTNPKIETLLKSDQISLIGLCLDKSYKISQYWQSMKICIRNNYIVKDANIWGDYLDLLQYFKKDIRNPKNICIEKLKEEHNKLVEKKRKIWEEESRIRRIQREENNRIEKEKKKQQLLAQIDKFNQEYQEAKGKFFDLSFSDNLINVVVLTTVDEFMQEGEALNHCVFQNEYFKEVNSLIMSARKGDERIETIEVSLEQLRILQCRGYDNEPTEFHDRIINLVRNNMHKIEERLQMVA